jgi:hypothetical protein
MSDYNKTSVHLFFPSHFSTANTTMKLTETFASWTVTKSYLSLGYQLLARKVNNVRLRREGEEGTCLPFSTTEFMNFSTIFYNMVTLVG